MTKKEYCIKHAPIASHEYIRRGKWLPEMSPETWAKELEV